MARRRARIAVRPAAGPDSMPVSARVAWTYLAVVAAMVGAGLVLVLSNQILAALVCPATDVDPTGDVTLSCKLSFAIWSTIAGFLLCLIPVLRWLKLDWWLWVAMFAGAGFLIAADGATEWWWWLSALLVPAAAALASADWLRGSRVRRWQLGGLLAIAAAAIGALAWWYLAG